MERVKKWLMSRKTGSTGAIFMGSAQDLTLADPHDRLQSQYELTSIKIRHLLERKQFQKVVDLLRELPRDHTLNCLESFPFNALNKAVPASFLIWETLLTKLKNSEDGYIPQFPYKSCDDLVMRVGWLMENNPGVDELQHSCRRVLKCVFMQYNEVLEQLYKEHERVNHALYTLTRHSPLGLGGPPSLTLTLEQAIKEEVQASLEDYTIVLECLNDLGQQCDQAKSNGPSGGDENEDIQKLSPNNGSGEGEEMGDATSKQIGTQQAPNPTQVQLHERLYRNQRMFNALKPSRRNDTLLQMVDHLKERIRGDKEVLHLFAKIKSRNPKVSKLVPVQPWLRKYEHALDLVIGAIKDIEKELEITVARMESPMQFGSGSTITSDEGGLQMIPSARPRSKSYEYERPLRHSAAPILDYTPMEEEGCDDDTHPRPPHRHLSIPSSFRPRSASPNKLLRVHGGSGGGSPGGVGSEIGHTHTGSIKSISSASNDSSSNLASRTSSSVHDLHCTGDQPPSLAFTRVQSLKTNKSVQVVAGKRKMPVTPNSLTNLTTNSISSSSMNYYSSGGKKKKHSCGSAELWDRHIQVNGDRRSEGELLLKQTLQHRDEELMCLQMQVQELRKRERALTDRLSEQAQRHLQGSEKFEDILMGNQRPTQVTQSYSELFSQTRVEALEEVEAVVNASGLGASLEPNFTEQLLLDVLTVSYAEASRALENLHSTWKTNLSVDAETGDSVAVKQLEAAVALYLRRVSMKHNTASIVKNMCEELSSRYVGCAVYKEISHQPQFTSYIQECASISWSLCVQTPAMVLDCSDTEYQADKHYRLYKSNMSSSAITQYLWPTLLQKSSGTVLSLGWVQT